MVPNTYLPQSKQNYFEHYCILLDVSNHAITHDDCIPPQKQPKMDFRLNVKGLALVAGVVLSLTSLRFTIVGAVETRKDLFSECPEWAGE